MPRLFTLQEANQLIQIIRPLMREILEIRGKIVALEPELWRMAERSAGNGGNPTLSSRMGDFDRLDALVHKILDLGAEIKDLGTGLLDFRADRKGRDVYLCWRYGEEEILFWHELDAGFAGRRAIATF